MFFIPYIVGGIFGSLGLVSWFNNKTGVAKTSDLSSPLKSAASSISLFKIGIFAVVLFVAFKLLKLAKEALR